MIADRGDRSEMPPASTDPVHDAPVAPATGAVDRAFTELAPGEEPVATGTLFLTVVLLMIIAAFWAIIYLRLLDR